MLFIFFQRTLKAFNPGVLFSFLPVTLLFPSFALYGSDIKGVVFNIPKEINKDVNDAIGTDNKARQTSIVTKNIDAKEFVANNKKNEFSLNVALGSASHAHQGVASL